MSNSLERPLWQQPDRLIAAEYPISDCSIAPPGIHRYGDNDTLRGVQPSPLTTCDDLKLLLEWVGGVTFPQDPNGKLTAMAAVHTDALTQATKDPALQRLVFRMCGGLLDVPQNQHMKILYLQKMTDERRRNGIPPPPLSEVWTLFRRRPEPLAPLDNARFHMRTYSQANEKKCFENSLALDVLHKACGGDEKEVLHSLKSPTCAITAMFDGEAECLAGVVFVEAGVFAGWGNQMLAVLTNAYIKPEFRGRDLYPYLQWGAIRNAPVDGLLHAETRLDGNALSTVTRSPPGRYNEAFMYEWFEQELPCLSAEYSFDGNRHAALLPHNIRSTKVFAAD